MLFFYFFAVILLVKRWEFHSISSPTALLIDTFLDILCQMSKGIQTSLQHFFLSDINLCFLNGICHYSAFIANFLFSGSLTSCHIFPPFLCPGSQQRSLLKQSALYCSKALYIPLCIDGMDPWIKVKIVSWQSYILFTAPRASLKPNLRVYQKINS